MRLGWLTMILATALAMTPVQAEDDVLFRDFSGEPRTVDAYAGDGKWLIVMIWAHDCHVCNVEAESYAQFHETHKDGKATVLGLSLDGAEKQADAEAFVARHDLPFPNLFGEQVTTMLYYAMQTGSQFRGTPSVLLFGPDGELRAAQAGAVPTSSIEAYIAKND